MTLTSRLTAAFAVVLFALLVVAPLPAEGQGSVESDRAALVALYDATGGDNWTNNANWKTDAPLSEWEFVVVNEANRVSELTLRNNNLTGEIPRELGSLTNIEQLRLNGNNLTGEIPRELGSLTNLERLTLGHNSLTGEIPRELGSLTNLERLTLDTNNLTGEIPRELGSLTNLEWLYLNDNNLVGEIPRELGSLTNLERLFLSGNNLTGAIPEELRRFEDTINPQQGGVNLPVGTPVPALPFVGALLLAGGLYVMGRRKMLRPR